MTAVVDREVVEEVVIVDTGSVDDSPRSRPGTVHAWLIIVARRFRRAPEHRSRRRRGSGSCTSMPTSGSVRPTGRRSSGCSMTPRKRLSEVLLRPDLRSTRSSSIASGATVRGSASGVGSTRSVTPAIAAVSRSDRRRVGDCGSCSTHVGYRVTRRTSMAEPPAARAELSIDPNNSSTATTSRTCSGLGRQDEALRVLERGRRARAAPPVRPLAVLVFARPDPVPAATGAGRPRAAARGAVDTARQALVGRGRPACHREGIMPRRWSCSISSSPYELSDAPGRGRRYDQRIFGSSCTGARRVPVPPRPISAGGRCLRGGVAGEPSNLAYRAKSGRSSLGRAGQTAVGGDWLISSGCSARADRAGRHRQRARRCAPSCSVSRPGRHDFQRCRTVVVPVAARPSVAPLAEGDHRTSGSRLRRARERADCVGDPAWRGGSAARDAPGPRSRRLHSSRCRRGRASSRPAAHAMRLYLAPLGVAVAERFAARWMTLDLDEDDTVLASPNEAAAYVRLLGVFAPLFDGLGGFGRQGSRDWRPARRDR